jgi:hypothetical protein
MQYKVEVQLRVLSNELRLDMTGMPTSLSFCLDGFATRKVLFHEFHQPKRSPSGRF